MSEQRKQPPLNGKKAYPGWVKVIKAQMTKDKLFKDGKVVVGKEEEASSHILSSVSYEIAEILPEGTDRMLQFLQRRFGDENKFDLIREYKDFTMQGIDPVPFLAGLDKLYARVVGAGGTIDADQAWTTMLSNCNQVFYEAYIRSQRLKHTGVITEDIVDQASVSMQAFYKATPKAVRDLNSGRRQFGTAAAAEEGAKEPEGARRHCTICAVETPSIQYYHSTENHRRLEDNPNYRGGQRGRRAARGGKHGSARGGKGGARPGNGAADGEAGAAEGDSGEEINDNDAYFDTGATQHFFFTKPTSLDTFRASSVRTAS